MKRLFALLAMMCVAISVQAAVPPIISYQGKITGTDGKPVPDGLYTVRFAIYDVPTGGAPIWSETNTAVQLKGGLFSVLLGSVVNLPANVFDKPNRFFGTQFGTDPEMTPRQQIASVPFALKAANADMAVTVADSSVTTSKVVDGAITAMKLAPGVAIPPGTILMWSGATTTIPQGWVLCNGQQGTPDLRNRFIVGSGDEYAVAATGGEKQHKLTVDEMPSHRHVDENSAHCGAPVPARPALVSVLAATQTGWGPEVFYPQGGDQPHENRPPYYALCFIMKLAY